MNAPLVVVDTVVFVGAVLGRETGADALIARAVATGELRLALSDDALRELVRVLGYPEVEASDQLPASRRTLSGQLVRSRASISWAIHLL